MHGALARLEGDVEQEFSESQDERRDVLKTADSPT